MKKLLFVIPLLLFGCEKEDDQVIETESANYQVQSINQFTEFKLTPEDTLLKVSISFYSAENILSAWFDIYSSDGKKLNSSGVPLLDNGSLKNADEKESDGIYSNYYALNESLPVGLYIIQYFVTDKSGGSKQVAFQQFNFDNGKENLPPVISNLNAPDELTISSTDVTAKLFLTASDPNGLSDIESVFFQSYRPDGTSSGTIFEMYDDGGTVISPSSGDETAGDGIYTLTIQMPPDTRKGTWRFEFQAKDRGKKKSNIISHNILVK